MIEPDETTLAARAAATRAMLRRANVLLVVIGLPPVAVATWTAETGGPWFRGAVALVLVQALAWFAFVLLVWPRSLQRRFPAARRTAGARGDRDKG